MHRGGLRLYLAKYNQIVHIRYLAKKRKYLESRVRLRAILLVHERNLYLLWNEYS